MGGRLVVCAMAVVCVVTVVVVTVVVLTIVCVMAVVSVMTMGCVMALVEAKVTLPSLVSSFCSNFSFSLLSDLISFSMSSM